MLRSPGMNPAVHHILGYQFYAPAGLNPALSQLLIAAPLKADAGQGNTIIAKDCEQAMGWDRPRPNSKQDKKKIAAKRSEAMRDLLDEIDVAVDDSIQAVRVDEMGRASRLLKPYAALWVGLYPIDLAEHVLTVIRAYQAEHQIADGYDGQLLTCEVGFLRIWKDW